MTSETIRTRAPGRLVLCLGSELLLFMPRILPGQDLARRFSNPATHGIVRVGQHNGPLNAFLGRAAEAARAVFHGPLTDTTLPWEGVDWRPFDRAGVDHHRDERIKGRFAETLRPFFASGKPVVVAGSGSRAYEGVHSSGTFGFGVADVQSQFLHALPLIGRFVRPRLKGRGSVTRGIRPTIRPRCRVCWGPPGSMGCSSTRS